MIGVSEFLVIPDGPTVQLLDRPAQGTGHAVHFGRVVDSGRPVVVKLARTRGALEREQLALAWLGGQRQAPGPELIAAGTALVGGRQVACLVTERRAGSPPTTIDGWERMGRAYAQLAALPSASGLPRIEREALGRDHARRINQLGDRLAPLAKSIQDWEQLASGSVPGSPPVVLTHGDPGPGNFLDDGNGGTIIDWEQAHFAPQGLDIARLFFIALLGAGPAGYIKTDLQARANAAVAGYLESSRWRPSDSEARWWTAVAGIQFIHRRWELDNHPAPWEEAAQVLERTLAGPSWSDLHDRLQR